MGSILIQGRLYSFDSSGPRHPDLGLRSWALGGITVPGTECVDARQEGSLRLSGSTKLISSPAPALAKHRLSQSAALERNHYAACWSLEGLFCPGWAKAMLCQAVAAFVHI